MSEGALRGCWGVGNPSLQITHELAIVWWDKLACWRPSSMAPGHCCSCWHGIQTYQTAGEACRNRAALCLQTSGLRVMRGRNTSSSGSCRTWKLNQHAAPLRLELLVQQTPQAAHQPGARSASLSRHNTVIGTVQRHTHACCTAAQGAADLPNRRWNSRSLAHTMQWMGLSGVLRMVQAG